MFYYHKHAKYRVGPKVGERLFALKLLVSFSTLHIFRLQIPESHCQTNSMLQNCFAYFQRSPKNVAYVCPPTCDELF